MAKKIVVLNGGPRLNGNTAELIKAFTAGAEANGHTVIRFDLERMNIHGCKGCLGGGKDPASPCVQKDDREKIYPEYKCCDLLVLASPMYYWGITGQLKCAIDRLFAVTESDPKWATPKQNVVLLMASEGNSAENSAPVLDYYHSLLKFLGWTDRGSIIAGGVLRLGDIKGHPALAEARELGGRI